MTALISPRGFGLAVFFAIATLVVGCGPNRKTVAKVGGTVTYRGKGVGGVSVLFSPIAVNNNLPGKSAIGITDADGRFWLSTYSENDGAVVGKHAIAISSSDPFRSLPGTYLGPNEVEVVAGENVFDFKLD
jgi:hypothetical protein